MEEGGWKSEEGAMLEGGGVGWNAETIWEKGSLSNIKAATLIPVWARAR